jgi:acetylornithine deacetylase/succinyl-diaminopimelate desuccinylase-like protein
MASPISDVRALVDSRVAVCEELLRELIRERSVADYDSIGRCLARIVRHCEAIGARIRQPEYDGLASLVCEWGPPDSTRRIILSGHVDVVPANEEWATDPFEITTVNDSLTARGCCDMKGAVSAFVVTLEILHAEGVLTGMPISLVLTGDEEVGSERGMRPLMRDRQIDGAFAIVGEPTDLNVFVGNRGLIWLEIAVHGRGGHAGMLHTLVNPVPVAAEIVRRLHALPLTIRDQRFDPPTPSLVVTWVDAGADTRTINTVPDVVTLGVDRRLLPGEEADQAIADIRECIDDLACGGITIELRARNVWPSYVNDVETELVRTARHAAQASGRSGAIGIDPATDDSSFLGEGGISTILLGPGHPDQAHVTNETLDRRDLRDAIEIYLRLITSLTKSAA